MGFVFLRRTDVEFWNNRANDYSPLLKKVLKMCKYIANRCRREKMPNNKTFSKGFGYLPEKGKPDAYMKISMFREERRVRIESESLRRDHK